MPNIRIPVLVKHCCIAIYREGKITARSQKDKFQQALKIAKAQMAKYGYIVLSGDKPSDPIGLTPKGRSAELRHKQEGRSKTVLFDTLYDKFDLEGLKEKAAKKTQEAAASQKVTAEETKKKQKQVDKSKAKEEAAVDREVRKRRR